MLKSIRTTKCPICGCTEIVEEYVDTSNYSKPEVREHCNGTRWEHRKFLCGYHTQYEPNFLREVANEHSNCCYDPELIAKKEKEKQDKDRIIEVLTVNNISQELIDKVKSYCL